jgi:hypothetical protein
VGHFLNSWPTAAARRRPEQVEQHCAAEALMRRAGVFGHHPPRDKEHHLASRKCRRESTPELGPRGVPGGPDTAKMTPQQEKNIPKTGDFDGHTA